MSFSPLVRDLRLRLGTENVLSAPSELAVYDCDALTLVRRWPEAVVFPRSTPQTVAVMQACRQHGAAVIARGAGTGLAGGCTAQRGGVVLSLARMNRVLEIDRRNRLAVVEPGVSGGQLSRALAGSGCRFAPAPFSQGASTIGGNVATNAAGPQSLRYGATVRHLLGLEAVLSSGAVLQLGPAADPAKLDLAGVLCGSEGTLGVATKIWLRLTPAPQDDRTVWAVFNSVDDAVAAATQILAAGIIPTALELLDQGILATVEEAFRVGFPPDAAAVLVIEVEDFSDQLAELDRQQQQVIECCRNHQARQVVEAATPAMRQRLRQGLASVIGAMGRLNSGYLVADGVVPRTQLPHLLGRIAEIGSQHQVRIVNVARAGQGSVQAIVLFDDGDPDEVARARAAGASVLRECIACGGSISAEHGVGLDKLPLMDRLFAPADLEALRHVRRAFDPLGLLNPGKVLPEGTAS